MDEPVEAGPQPNLVFGEINAAVERRENVPGDIVLGVPTIGAVTPARTCSSARVEKAMSDSASEQSSTERFQVAGSFGCARPW